MVCLRLLQRYAEPGYRLSMLEMQKLAYFMQVAGEDLKLDFVRHKYGPYAETLNYPLQRIEGHYIRGYGDRSRDGQVYLLPGAAEESAAFLAQHPDSEQRLKKVSDLITGFENPYGMELLATVHWVAWRFRPQAKTSDEAVKAVHSWSKRKQTIFKADHIKLAWSRLREQGWLRPQLIDLESA